VTAANPEPWRRQRADAERNEARILRATRALLREHGAGAVEMRDVARAAGVGVGTVYRRFGDKASLLGAVLGADERRLQDAIVSGEPPLGPGAPPAERLDAFLTALAAFTEDNLDALLATAAVSSGRMEVGSYSAWRLHLAHLLSALRPDLDEADRGWYADALLAALDPGVYAVQRRRLGIAAERVARNLRALARAVVGG